MPLTVGPDPQNPGKLIWIDSATGQPATQVGPGEPLTVPSSSVATTPPAGSKPTGLADLLKQQGEGWTATGNAAPKLDNDGMPVPGVYTIVLAGPNGAQRIATVYSADTGQGPTQFVRPDADLPNAKFSIVAVEDSIKPPTTSPEEKNANVAKAQADAATAQANAAVADAALKKVQEDERERQYNQAHGNGYLTHEELRKLNQDAAQQGLDAQQVALRRSEIENNNRNTVRSNEIAAINAQTSALNAQSQAQAQLARTKYEEGQLGLDEAKFAWQKSQDEINQQNAASKIRLDQLTQQQANELAQATLEQRKAEAAQTQQTAATTAAATTAASVFGTERQAQTAAGTVGENLLSNRATATNNLLNNILSGAAGMSQGSAGRYGMLGGGLQTQLPANFGSQLLSGVMGTTAQQFGGQSTLDAAAQMVRNAAPGAELTPHGQVAMGIIHQIFDRFPQLQPKTTPTPTPTPTPRATGGGFPAPGAQYNATSQPFGPNFGGGQATGAFGGFSAPAVQSGIPEGTNRGAAPTIVINA